MDPVIRLQQEADHCSSWSNGPGAQYAVHAHPYRKILYVTAGSITFTPEGARPVTMGLGDRIEIPAGTPQGALVGPQGVTCWEGQARIHRAGEADWEAACRAEGGDEHARERIRRCVTERAQETTPGSAASAPEMPARAGRFGLEAATSTRRSALG